MKISNISYSEKLDLFEITTQPHSTFWMDYTSLEEYQVSVEQDLDLETYEQFIRQSNWLLAIKSARDYCLRSIRCSKDVSNYLYRKGYDKNLIQEVVIWLHQNQLLDDEVYARLLVQDKKHLYHHSRRRIKQLLQQKSIDKEIIELVLEDVVDEDDESNAFILGEKKWNTLKDPLPLRKQKVIRYLFRKGFNFETALGVVDGLMEND